MVTDNLNTTGLTFVSCTATAPDTCSHAAGIVTWTISALPTNTTRSALLTVRSATTGTKTNTITANTTGTPTASVTVTVSNTTPSITTLAASSVAATSAILNGSVNPNGSATTANFGYSAFSGSYGSTCTPVPSSFSGSTVQSFACTLTGLTCNRTYYFRASGTNAAGTSNGGELAFTTAACPPATVNLDAVEVGAGAGTNLYTKLSGQSFNLDLLALTSTGAVDTLYNRTVTPELVDAGSSASCAGMTLLQAYPAYTFTAADNGRKTYAFNHAGAAANVRVRLRDDSATPITACSTNNFAIRPQRFDIGSAAANADATGSSATATPAISAGAPFSLTASSSTSGYTGTPLLDASLASAHPGAIQVGALAGTFAAASGATGQATGSAFSYGEVGYFMLGANGVFDSSFTTVDSTVGDCVVGSTSNVANASGRFGCNIGSTATSYFGRFIPALFVQTSGSVSAACAAGDFTYMGQNFTIATTIEARNALVPATKAGNYHGGYAKGTVSIAAENGDNGTDLSARISALPAGTWTQGLFTLNGSSSVFSRSGMPDGPFESLLFGVAVADADGPVLSSLDMNPAAVGSGSPTHKQIGAASTRARYGRLRLVNHYGSPLLNPRVEYRAEYWNVNRWVTNLADTCTVLAPGNIARPTGLSVPVVGAMNAGIGFITFAPVAAGSYDIAVNLGTSVSDTSCNAPPLPGSTPANQTWLKGHWSAPASCGGVAAWAQDPSARIKLGSPRAPYIYLRERY